MKPRVGIIASISATGETGGAERFFTGLHDALTAIGIAAELIDVPNDERTFDRIKESYLRFFDLDLRGFDGVISAKAPSYVVRHKNHVCYLMHTIRVFYDMFEWTFARPSREALEQRRLIHALDTAALRRLGHIFAIGEEVAQRLRSYLALDAEVLRHPTSLPGLRAGSFKYLFLPGRLHRWKRADLVIEAMRLVEAPIDLVIAGTGEDEDQLKRLAQPDSRIRFVGRVRDEELAALYADALAVLFTPRNEDLGLVTLEAFRSGKPVITCTDSGEPARLVKNGESGFICLPDAGALATRIAQLVQNPTQAAVMGRQGAQSILSVTWEAVATKLAGALGFGDTVAARTAAG